MEKVIIKQVSQKTIIKNYGVPSGSTGGKIDGAVNLGDGEGIFTSVQNKLIQLKSLKKQSDKLIIVSSMNDISFDVDDSKLNINKSQVDGLDEDIDNINTNISTINTNINNINNSLSNLGNSVTQNTTDINTINNAITSINNYLSDLTDEVNQNTSDINSMSTSITNINNTLTSINNSIDTINNTLSTQQTYIESLDNTIQFILDMFSNLSLSYLNDVVITNPLNKQNLQYNETNQKFENKYLLGDIVLDDNISNIQNGMILQYYQSFFPPPIDQSGWKIVYPTFIQPSQLDTILEEKISKFRNKYSVSINPLNVTSNASGAQYLTYTGTTGVTSGSLTYPALTYITNTSDPNYVNNVNNGKARVRFTTATAVNSFASLTLNVRNMRRGFSNHNENVFTIRYRIRINANSCPTLKLFIGCAYTQFSAYNINNGATTEPFETVTSFGMGCTSTETEFKIGSYYNESTAKQNVLLSSSSSMTSFDYLKNKTNDTDFFIEITTPTTSPGGFVWCRITNISNGNSALFSWSPTYLGGTTMPASGYFLYPQVWIGNGSTAQAVSFELFNLDVYQNN